MSAPNPFDRSVAPHRRDENISIGARRPIQQNSFMSGAGDSNLPHPSPAAPPLPPRPSNTSDWNGGYNSYGGNLGPVTNPYYSSMSSFPSCYGYNSGGYGRLPYSNSMYGSADSGHLVRLAEEQSRNTFHSIESVVQAFSSISMMLESTLNAFYSSFRAILGVADQFSRLKLQLSQMLTTLAIVRFLRWLWRRLLLILRLRRASANVDGLWTEAADCADIAPTAAELLLQHGADKSGGHWSTLIFFTCIIGGPYLIYRLVSKLAATVEDQKRWATGERTHFLAVALYDFNASSAGELSIRAGDRIRLAPKELQPQVRGWILGSVDGSAVGLVPANYIKIQGKETVGDTSTSQALVSQAVGKKPAPSKNGPEMGDFERIFDSN